MCCHVLHSGLIGNCDVCEEFRCWVVDNSKSCKVFGSDQSFRLSFSIKRIGKSRQYKGEEGNKEDNDLEDEHCFRVFGDCDFCFLEVVEKVEKELIVWMICKADVCM